MTTSNTVTSSDFSDVSVLVDSAFKYVLASEILAEAKNTADTMRETMLPILRAHQKDEWKVLGKHIKSALSAVPKLNEAQVIAWHGVFKTCFEYRILPTQASADRLRKADVWLNWNGNKVPNTYGKVHAPKPEVVAPIVKPLPASEPVKSEPVKSAPIKVNADKAVLPKANVNGTDTLSQFEHYEILAKQFMEHGLHKTFIDRLAGVICIKPEVLALAFRTVSKDMIEQGKALEAKRK